MVLSVGGSFAYFARNARCTVTTDLLVWYSNTQNDFSPGAAIFSQYTIASPSGRNVNYDEKRLTGGKKLSFYFYLYRFHKYMFYGFFIINFCNPRVHYETPCIIRENIEFQVLVYLKAIHFTCSITIYIYIYFLQTTSFRLTRVIFQHIKRLLPPERPFSHYIHSHRLAAEMWTTVKNKCTGKKKNFGCSFYLYMLCEYVSYGFPTINICNPCVYYEAPYIIREEHRISSISILKN